MSKKEGGGRMKNKESLKEYLMKMHMFYFKAVRGINQPDDFLPDELKLLDEVLDGN